MGPPGQEYRPNALVMREALPPMAWPGQVPPGLPLHGGTMQLPGHVPIKGSDSLMGLLMVSFSYLFLRLFMSTQDD